MKTARRAAAVLLAGSAFASASQAIAETPLERGAYLMRSIVACGNCHTPQGPKGPIPGMELAGGLKIEEKEFTVYTPNITPDPDTGVGKWTGAQLIAAIRECKRPDGSRPKPPMGVAYYANMTDRDLDWLIAYLRTLPRK